MCETSIMFKSFSQVDLLLLYYILTQKYCKDSIPSPNIVIKDLQPSMLSIQQLQTHLRTRSHQPLRFHRRPLRPISTRPRRPSHPILHEPTRNILHRIPKRINTLLRRLEPSSHKRLLEIEDDVFDIFQAQADADQVGRDTTLDLFFVGELLVRGDPGVDDEGFCVADVGEVGAEFEVIYYRADLIDVAGLAIASYKHNIAEGISRRTYHTERQHTTSTIWHSLLRMLIIPMALQARIQHPADTLVRLEPLSEFLRVFAMALSTQRQCLQTLEEQPCVEGGHAGAQVAHGVHAELGGEGFVAVGFPEAHAVISGSRVSRCDSGRIGIKGESTHQQAQ